jgi:hypothetical protein
VCPTHLELQVADGAEGDGYVVLRHVLHQCRILQAVDAMVDALGPQLKQRLPYILRACLLTCRHKQSTMSTLVCNQQ